MEYERTQSGAKFHGLRYECYMAALLYLRCLRKEVDDFRIGCNVEGLDLFDDVVMRFTSEEKAQSVLIQMKHREKGRKVTLNQLLAPESNKKNEFSLKKYYKAYCNIQKSCTDIPILNGIDFNDCEFVIFTNSVLLHKSCNVTNLSPWENLVNGMGGTDSEIFSFTPEDKEIWSLSDGQEDSEMYHTFIRKLRVFSGQCDVHRLRGMVKDEVQICSQVQNKASENLLSFFLSEIEAWWNNDDAFLKSLLDLGREGRVDQLCVLITNKMTSPSQEQGVELNSLCSFIDQAIRNCGDNYSEFLPQLQDSNRQKDLDQICNLLREMERREPQRFYSFFLDIVKSRRNRIQCLTKLSPYWIKALISHLNNGMREKLRRIDCTWKPDSVAYINGHLTTDMSLNVFAPECHNILQCARIFVKLEKHFSESYLLMDATDVQREIQNVHSVCESGHCRVLVIAVKNNPQFLQHTEGFRSKTCSVVYLSETKIDVNCDLVKDTWTFSDLSSDTQECVSQRRVEFQGEEVELVELCGSTILQNLDGKVLSALLMGEKVKLGRPLPPVPEIYIPRSMCHQAVLSEEVLKVKHKDDVFVVSNAKDSVRRDGNVIHYNDRCGVHLSYEGNNLHFEKDHPDKRRFGDLCNKYGNKKGVHWVEYQHGLLVWRQTSGSEETPKRFVKRINSYCGSGPRCSHEAEHWSDKLILVTGEPGMGKTTLLHFVAQEIKRKTPLSWVLFVPLFKYTNILRKAKAEDITMADVEEILVAAASDDSSTCSQLERQLIMDSVTNNGNITVLLDAVDEISPVYTDHVLNITRLLRATKISSLWVTSRTVIQERLQRDMPSLPFILQPLTEEQQLKFMSQYIEHMTGEGNNLDVKLLLKNTSNIGSSSSHVCSIPLHARMISDVAAQTVKTISYTDSSELDQQQLTLYKIYKNFFERKRKNYYEKYNIDIETQKVTGDLEIAEKHFVDIHMKCATVAVFSQEEINRYNIPNFQTDIEEELQKMRVQKTGIIDGWVNNTPKFIHYTFAEYFVALWLAKNCMLGREKVSLEILFGGKYELLRRLFDELLSEDFKLHTAVLTGDASLVKQLLVSGVHAGDVDRGGRLALHLAAARSDSALVGMLLRAGSPVQTTDKVLGWSPLRYADQVQCWVAAEQLLQNGAKGEEMNILRTEVVESKDLNTLQHFVQKGHLQIIKLILDMGYNINEINRWGKSLLHESATSNYTSIVRELLSRNPDINMRDSGGQTPLHIAASKGNVHALRVLLTHNACINLTDNRGQTPLHIAAYWGRVETLRDLLSHNADINITDSKGQTLLHVAAYIGNVEALQELLSHNPNINITDNEGQTLLHVAVNMGRVEALQELLSHNPDINIRDNKGRTPLHTAASQGNVQELTELLDHNPDINITDSEGQTPLHVAAYWGRVEALRELLSHNPDINITDNKGQTPLHTAASEGDVEAIRELISYNPDINITDSKGQTLLHVAAYSGKVEAVRELLSHNPDINIKDKEGRTPLHTAAYEGNDRALRELLSHKPDINITDNKGQTPLHVAAYSGKVESLRELISYNPDVNIAYNEGQTPLHTTAYGETFEEFRELISYKPDINITDSEGQSPLHTAASVGNVQTLRELLSHSPDINISDNRGQTPLHVAAYRGRVEALRELISHNPDMSIIDNEGQTPLHVASLEGNVQVLRELLSHNSDINITNRKRQTPLHVAAYSGRGEAIRELLSHNPDISIRDNEGQIPLHIAASIGNVQALRELISHNPDITLKNSRGQTPLHVAACRGRVEALQELLSHSPDINIKDSRGQTPLHLTAYRGEVEALRELISHKPDINITNKRGLTPLHAAAFAGNVHVVRELLSHNPNINIIDKEGQIPIHTAASMGNVQALRELISHNPDINITNSGGQTPLHVAACRGRFEALQELLSHNPDINITDSRGLTPLHAAASVGNIQVIRELFTHNPDIHITDNDGRTPLHAAAYRGGVDALRELLSHNPDINITDSKGRTPLHVTAYRGGVDALRVLLSHNPVVNITDNEGQTPLHVAVSGGDVQVIRELISYNSDINITDSKGQTPLHVAASDGNGQVLRELLSHNPDINITDSKGQTPLHTAASEGDLEAIRVLLSHDADVNMRDKLGRTPLHVAADSGVYDTFHIFHSYISESQFQTTNSALRYE